MNNYQAVVEQIVQNLAFEVEAVPKNKLMEATSISQSTPLNVKIKVRKKNETLMQHDVSSIAENTPRGTQKIRLVNSDRTIMTFDVFMEAEFDKRPSRKLRKHIFDMLRPGICLGAVDDDEYPYLPSSSYSANITEPSVTNKSDGTLKQTFTLSKNVYQAYTVSTQPKEQKWMFGKCKPGGCLDPPFSEDKYSYKPSIRSGPEREGEEPLKQEDVASEITSKKIPITLHDEEVESNGRHSSIFDSGLFKKKRKSSDKSTNTKLPDTTDSIVDIYQGESVKNSVSAHSNSIITYPPKVRSNPRISDDKTVRSRGPSEDKSRKSFNDHSEPYFIRPKGVNRIKERETLDPSDYPKHRSSDATDLRNSLKESFKIPLPLPIPVPIPIMPNKQKPEVIATNDNILKTQGSAHVAELDAIPDQKPQDQELQNAVNSKDTNTPLRLLRYSSATGDTDDKLVESSKILTITSIASNVEQPTTPNETDDQNLQEIKLKPLKEIDSENNIEQIKQHSKKPKTEPLNMPVSVPVPFIFSEYNHAAALDPNMIDDNLQRSEIQTQSNQSFETKTTPPTIKDTPFEDSKDMHKNIDGADAIPEHYLRTRGSFSDQEIDTENPVTIVPKMVADIKGIKKPAKQNDINDKVSTFTAVAAIGAATAAAAVAAAAVTTIEGSSEICEMQDTDTQNIKGSQEMPLSKLPISKRSISILSGSKTSAASVKDKTKRSNSPDKHLDNTGHRDADKSIPIISGSKTSAASVKDKSKRSDSPDKYLDNTGHRDTEKSISILSGSKTSAASVKDKSKRSDSPDKYLDNTGHRDTYKSISILSGSKTSAASVKDKSKRSNSPDKHLDDIGHRDTEKIIPKLSRAKTSAASVSDKTKRSDSPDKHLNNAENRDTDKLISILSGSNTLAASVKDKSKRTDSPDKHLDNTGHRDADKSISILSGSKTSAASLKDKSNRSDSPDKQLDNVGHRDSEKSVPLLSRGKTSAASVIDKTKRNESPDKHWDNVEHRDDDLGVHKDEKKTYLSNEVTSAASVKDETERSDSPDKYLDSVEQRDTEKSISILSGSKTSAVSVTDKTKRSDSPKKHLDSIGHRDTEKGIPILSRGKTSAASVTDKAKRSDSPDKYLDSVGYGDTDLAVHKNDKRTSLSSGPKYKTDTRYAKISEPPSVKEYVNETEKPNNNDTMLDTESEARFTGVGSMNFKAAPVIIDNTILTSNFEPLKEVFSETNLFGEPMDTGHEFDPSGVPFTTQIASRLRKFDEDDGTHSTVSRELIGTKSVIYDTDGYIPNMSTTKSAERIPSSDKRVIPPVDIPSIQSTSTLKSAMKKDTMSVELGFRSYFNDKNERMLQTFDAANTPKRMPNDSITVLKSQIRISSNEIRIPVDSEHDMFIQIKKSNGNQRVSISESRFANVIDKGRVKQQRPPVQCSDAEMRSSAAKTEVKKENILENEATDDHFIDYYEQELVPLQLIIKNLRDEIDVLAAQQLVFKEKLFCANKSKIPRVVHSNKKCFGCVRK